MIRKLKKLRRILTSSHNTSVFRSTYNPHNVDFCFVVYNRKRWFSTKMYVWGYCNALHASTRRLFLLSSNTFFLVNLWSNTCTTYLTITTLRTFYINAYHFLFIITLRTFYINAYHFLFISIFVVSKIISFNPTCNIIYMYNILFDYGANNPKTPLSSPPSGKPTKCFWILTHAFRQIQYKYSKP